ncbi:MAG: hypothetical protein LCH59_11430 [Proteobacteria bacterium]|nr:hypothetical protein [Pseudomonadota bacterium]
MAYDNRDRLLTVASPLYPGGATYAYDVLDNLTRVTVAGRQKGVGFIFIRPLSS